jgi:hypothetical protein
MIGSNERKTAGKGGISRLLKIFVLRISARIKGRRHFRIGSCFRCGMCCRQMRLFYRDKLIDTCAEFQALLESDPSFSIFTPTVGGEGPLTFTCIHVTDQGRCDNYSKRPASCRAYPDGDLVGRFKGDMIEGCGYELITVDSFDGIFSRCLKDKGY